MKVYTKLVMITLGYPSLLLVEGCNNQIDQLEVEDGIKVYMYLLSDPRVSTL
jgi:hypothetical protein